MTDRRLIDYDPLTGIRQDYLYDHTDDKAHLHTTQDATLIVEEAKRLRSQDPNFKGGFVHKASLSFVQCMELIKMGIMDRGFAIRDEVAFNIWLKENNQMKTYEGNL